MMENQERSPLWGRHTSGLGSKRYDVYSLREYAEALPVQEVPLEDLRHLLEQPDCWTDTKGNRMGPMDILKDWWEAQKNLLWEQHVDKIAHADLDYPVWLTREGDLIDGMHRLAKAAMLKTSTVKVKIFEHIPESSEIKD